MISDERVQLVIATEDDSVQLSQIQKAAFDEEARLFHRSEACGPEGYDTVSGQIALMQRTHFYKIMSDGAMVGGVAVIDSDRICRLVRIFMDPQNQGKGIGHAAFRSLMERYPTALKWELDMPSWSSRSHQFYQSLGFIKVGATDEGGRGFPLLLFEMKV
jgi:GNAT superfamily N-acetyltransferase